MTLQDRITEITAERQRITDQATADITALQEARYKLMTDTLALAEVIALPVVQGALAELKFNQESVNRIINEVNPKIIEANAKIAAFEEVLQTVAYQASIVSAPVETTKECASGCEQNCDGCMQGRSECSTPATLPA